MPTKFFNLDTDSQFTANSDYYIASQKAVKTALDTKADKESTYTKEEVNNLITSGGNFPDQSDNAGKFLTTDGENPSWDYTSVINDVTNSTETGLSKLVINKLSQEEYDNLLEQNAIQDNELYIINDGNSQYVTEEELQQSLITKADVDNVYTKEEVYTKNEVDNIVSTKADQETTYTKNEVDDLLANFEGGDSLPSQEGNEGKSLVTDGVNANWEFTTIRRNLEDGTETGLSQLIINTLSKERYNELEANGQINENELYITSGDDVEQPSRLSDFENDVGFITLNDIEHKADKETTYTKDEVNELLANF